MVQLVINLTDLQILEDELVIGNFFDGLY